MCGRYVLVSSPEEIAATFAVTEVATESLGQRWNVAPSLDVYAIIGEKGSRRLGSLTWGFVPWFAKDPKRAPINARAETVARNGMFSESFAKRRCILPADGFWEWQAVPSTDGGKPRKQPWHFADPDGGLLAFAGIHSTWRDRDDPDAPKRHTTAIITTAAQGAMEPIHDRMPVLLPPRLWDAWLDPETDVPRLGQMIQSVGPPALRAFPVTTDVNNVRNEGPGLLTEA